MASITMFGTGCAMVTRCYNTCFYLQSEDGGIMVDAGGGNGILRQIEASSIDYSDIHHLFVTHCHTDHIMGVVWLIRKISPLQHKRKYSGVFTIYGHDEALAALREMCRLMIPAKICRAIDDTIVLHEVHDGDELRVGDMDLTVFDIGSKKMKQFGFVATLPDGKRVAVTGDEPLNMVNEHLIAGADWLLSEAFCLYAHREQFRPYEKYHSTALDAGLTARVLGVKNLLLYHTEDHHLDTRRRAYAAEAGSQFKGNIVVPDDLEVITL